MDKETLSNYGWIVICVLVLAVMIALAGPFGNFVADAVKSTTQGLFDVNKNALDAAGVPGLTVQDQEFEDSASTDNAEEAGLYKSDGTFISWDDLVKDGIVFVENGVLTTGYYEIEDGEDYIFSNNSSTALDGKLLLPEGITTIGDFAFSYCTSLTSITLSDSVTEIGGQAFENCTALSSVIFAEDGELASICGYSFRNCISLTSIVIPDSVTFMDGSIFENCTALTNVTIGSGVTNLGDATFMNCTSLTSITIPDNVTDLGFYAFMNCTSLTSITIPSNIRCIGTKCFYGTSLSNAVFENTTGWKIVGEDVLLNSTDLADPSTAATYLTSTYSNNTLRRY